MNIEKCKGCDYWRGVNGTHSSEGLKFCHFLLLTGKCRQRDGDTCLSRTPRKRIRRSAE